MTQIPVIPTYSPHPAPVQIGDRTVYYSYNTLIAYETHQLRIRLVSPSRTTTLDLKKMGVEWFEVVPDSMFFELINL